MTKHYRKKLIEVALPLDAINRESAREKSIRHGHPSTLHLWWARRPLAACRAVLFSSLVDDPESDPAFNDLKGEIRDHAIGERRQQLFWLIEELVKWDNSNNDTIINAARAEIARSVASRKLELGELKKDQPLTGGITPWDLLVRGQVKASFYLDKKSATSHIAIEPTKLPAEAVNAFLAEHAPPVLDPFCGGGSIPLEAQRLGLRAFAGDLNPVPVLINKALIEIPPKFAGCAPVNPQWQNKSANEKAARLWRGVEGLAEDVRYYGKWMRDEAEKLVGHLYPQVKITMEMAKDRADLKNYVGEELTVIAWLWSRTIQCANPACGARTPLIQSFELSRKPGRKTHLNPIVDSRQKSITFRVVNDGRVPKANSDRNGAVCLFCHTSMNKAVLRELATRHGTAPIPMAMVCDGKNGRFYLPPSDYPPVPSDGAEWDFLRQPMTNDKRWFSPPLYGLPCFADVFTQRQIRTLLAFSDGIAKVRQLIIDQVGQIPSICSNEASTYATAVATYLAFAQSKACNRNTTLCIWESRMDRLVATFGRQALPMVWCFAETNPFAGAGGDLFGAVESVCEVLDKLPASGFGEAVQRDATTVPRGLKNSAIATDPPYYDNIGYADLSDFFYLWLRRSLSSMYPDLFSTVLTPKSDELIASSHRHGGSREKACSFFESGLKQAFSRMSESTTREIPVTIYYAFKQSEEDSDVSSDGENNSAHSSTGWETMLEALIEAGFSISGTWPMRTEQPKGLRAFEQNALASSIVLVCNPRGRDASMTTRKDFVAELKKELPTALRNLQIGNIAPVDLAQAAIGPGMAIYSRYAKVVNNDGSRMPVRTALQLINQALDEVLSELESEFDSDTRWAIKWFEQHAHDDGVYGDAETLSKAMAVSVSGLKSAGLIKSGQNKVRLLKRDELAAEWDPTTDKRLTIWEVTQHLIRQLEEGGETAAANLLRKVGSLGEIARDLAYRLYSTCERKKWAEEARSYNGLVVAWPEIGRMSREAATTSKPQAELEFD